MRKICFAFLVVLTTCGTSQAAITYTLELDQASYSLLPGESVSSDIFLIERVTSGDVNVFEGMAAARFQIGADTANTLSAADGNSAFSLINSATAVPAINGFLINNIALVPAFIDATTVSASERRLLMGNVTLTAGASVGDIRTISFSDPSGLNDMGARLDGTTVSLDSIVFASSPSITVTAIPEPGVMAFGMVVVGALGVRSIRRRRAVRAVQL